MYSELTSAEEQYYRRHIALTEVGKAGQMRLKKASALCVGAGGLGSAALMYLAAAGVGRIGIVDHDVVETSNLHRQVLYTVDDVGEKKVIVAQQRLTKLNPHIQIDTHEYFLSSQNAFKLIKSYDIVLDCSDNFKTRYVVNAACVKWQKPNVYAAISQFEGQCTVFANNKNCYRCLYPAPPLDCLSCADAGVLGVLPGMIGTIQAAEVIKLILNIGTSLQNRLINLNALTLKMDEYELAQDENCKTCQLHDFSIEGETMSTEQYPAELSVEEFKQLRETNADFTLLDVREKMEYDICHLNGVLIPLQQLPERLAELNKEHYIVVHCRSGGRSRNAMQFLKSQGFAKVSNLSGGILEWADKFDTGMQKY